MYCRMSEQAWFISFASVVPVICKTLHQYKDDFSSNFIFHKDNTVMVQLYLYDENVYTNNISSYWDGPNAVIFVGFNVVISS